MGTPLFDYLPQFGGGARYRPAVLSM